MNFYIDKLLLWLKDGSLETIPFENDKINIITGNSKTGKTAILEIIDYCLCGGQDTVTISHEKIGENVSWYGIRFYINDKVYTIARGEISETKGFSNDYYFSQTGEIPELPFSKLDEAGIKKILDPEFSVDDDVTLSYGGKGIRKNTRLSFRYFLMFNTLSKDIIDNGKIFFDKMNVERYRNVWHQIFDLSLGIIDFNILEAQKDISDLEQEIITLEQRKKRLERNSQVREVQVEQLTKKAKEAHLINEDVPNDKAFSILKQLVEAGPTVFATDYSLEQESEKLQAKREDIALQLAKLRRFKHSYEKYRGSLSAEADALRPVEYIEKHFSDRTSGEYRYFLKSLSDQLREIRADIKNQHPFEVDVDRKIRDLSSHLKQLDRALGKMPQVQYRSIPTANKLITYGEICSEIKHIDPPDDSLEALDKNISKKQTELEEKESRLSSIAEKRTLTIESLNDYIQLYIQSARDALDEYGDYYAWFDYKKSALALRKSKSASVANLSSSSDHLFVHLCLFAGLHNMLHFQDTHYIPSFLIMDQPSRPYFNANENYNFEDSENVVSNKDDWSKVTSIFKLWDYYMSLLLSKGKHFQIIMLEHVSEKAWNGCKHTNLVAKFDGIHNALIPLKKSNSANGVTDINL